MASESAEAAFERGHTAGVTAAELQEHGARLTALNGSIARHATALEDLALAVQGLTATTEANNAAILAQMASAEETVRTTAAALAAAEAARRDKSESAWSPLARIAAAAGALSALLGAYFLLRPHG